MTTKRGALVLTGAALGSLMLVGAAADLVLGGTALRSSDEPVLRKRPPPPPPPLGLGLAALEPSAARAMGLATGLRVQRATGSAYERGLRVGDIIVEVNGRAVSSVEGFWDSVAAAGWQATLKVLRDGKPQSVKLAAVNE